MKRTAETTTNRPDVTETTAKSGAPSSTTQKAEETTTQPAPQTPAGGVTGGSVPTTSKPSVTTTKSGTPPTEDERIVNHELPAIPLR